MNALDRLHESRSPHLRALIFVTLLALTFAGGFAVAAHKTVTLTVDGTEMTVATMKSRVIDVVKENGYDVGDRYDLYPAGDQAVHQSDAIVLRRSRPLQISTDGENSRRCGPRPPRSTRPLPSCRWTTRRPRRPLGAAGCRWAACRCPW